jgi:Zn-dependent peptidase ImmA (M78 family)
MRTSAEAEARRVLAEHGIKTVPVPVERIAARLGASISHRPFEDGVSGMLFRGDDDGMKLIGVNSSHSSTRQRFTIAHEIGHLLLHKGRPMILDAPGRVNMRDSTSSQATDAEEIEANSFAAELLMPSERTVEEFRKRMSAKGDKKVERVVAELAKRFDVSPQAMQFRLVNLNLVLPG